MENESDTLPVTVGGPSESGLRSESRRSVRTALTPLALRLRDAVLQGTLDPRAALSAVAVCIFVALFLVGGTWLTVEFAPRLSIHDEARARAVVETAAAALGYREELGGKGPTEGEAEETMSSTLSRIRAAAPSCSNATILRLETDGKWRAMARAESDEQGKEGDPREGLAIELLDATVSGSPSTSGVRDWKGGSIAVCPLPRQGGGSPRMALVMTFHPSDWNWHLLLHVLPVGGAAVVLVVLLQVVSSYHRKMRQAYERELVAKSRILESERWYRQLFENGAAVKLLIDPRTGQIVDANGAACRFYGYTREEIVALRIHDINTMPAKRIDEVLRNASEAAERHYSFRHRLASGEERDVEAYTGLVTIGGKDFVHAVVQDVTEKRRAEDTLLRTEERYHDIFENAAMGIYQTTPEGRYSSVNPAMARILGYDSPEDLMASVTDVARQCYVHPEQRKVLFSSVLEEGPQSLEVEVYRKDQSRIWILNSVRTIRDSDGKLRHFEGFIFDISKRKQMEQSLRDHNAALEVVGDLRAIPTDVPEETVWRTFLQGLVAHFGFRMAWCGSYREGRIRPELHAGTADKYLENLVLDIAEPTNPDARCAMSRAILDGRPFGYEDLAHDRGFRAWRAYALELGYASNLAIPLRVGGETEGGVMVYGSEVGEFTAERTERLAGLVRELGATLADRRRRIRAEEALRESERRFRMIVEEAPMGVVLYDQDGLVLHANKASLDIFGVPAEEVKGCRIFDDAQVPPDIKGRLNQGKSATYDQVYDFDQTRRTGTLPTRRTGTAHLEGTLVPLLDDTGDLEGFISLVLDVTQRKRVEAELRESRDFQRMLLDSLPVAVFAKDADSGRFILWNRACEVLFGIAAEDALGKTDRDFFPAEQAEAYRVKDQEVLRAGRTLEVSEEPVESVRLGRRLIHTVKTPVFHAGGHPSVLLVWSEDITERKRAEEALKKVQEDLLRSNLELERAIEEVTRMAVQAEAANVAKSEFLANMSHEIRTPLNPVLGFTDLLLDGETEPERREMLRMVKQRGEDLLVLINDILDLSKVEAGKLALDPTECDTRKLAADSLETLAQKAEEKDLALNFQVEPDVPKMVLVDGLRLRQVLINLLSNAVKFTEAGEITLSMKRLPDDTGASSSGSEPPTLPPRCEWLQFSVTDTGVGIERGDLYLLFQPFMQADGSTTRRYGGTGLGLAICKRIVERMGGRIWVESDVGRGSCFSFVIPVERCSTSQRSGDSGSRNEESRLARRLRLLVVDDDRTNQLVAKAMLTQLGHTVTAVCGAKAALEALEEKSYDAVLMDIMMPEMDGFEATAEIRRREADLGRRTTIIAMTAKAMDGDREECLRQGLDDYVAKPMTRETLRAALERSVPEEASPPQTPARSLESTR